MEQAVIEVRIHVDHAPQGLENALPDQLHPGNRLPYAPENVGLGHMAQVRPLLSSGLLPRIQSYLVLTIPREAELLSAEAAEDPGRIRLSNLDFQGATPKPHW